MTVESNLWYPPAVPNALDDEFDGTNDLATFWDLNFTVDPLLPDDLASFASGNVRASQNVIRNSWLTVQPPTDGNHYTISKAPSPGVVLPDGFYWARVSSRYSFGSIPDNNNFGIFISATSGGDRDINNSWDIYLRETEAGEITIQAQETDNGASAGQEMSDHEGLGVHWQYIGILKDGAVVHLFAGTEGGSWTWVEDFTINTPAIVDRFGIYFRSANADTPGATVHSIDFFRYTASKNTP